jgi:hypothetical protein
MMTDDDEHSIDDNHDDDEHSIDGLIRADNSKSTRRELDPELVKVIYGMKIN